MSDHLQPQSPELVAALHNHGLKSDQPSQLSDAFRLGWNAARALPAVQPDPLGAEWKPIGTAPRDGTWFIAIAGRQIRFVHFADSYDRFPINSDSRCWTIAPTHWCAVYDADLDRAAMERPVVRALVEAAIKAKNTLEIYEDEEMAGELRAALDALPKGVK